MEWWQLRCHIIGNARSLAWALDRNEVHVKSLLLVLGTALLVGSASAQTATTHSYVPAKGFVPDSSTAVRIAVAVWGPIYGEQHIAGEQPYRATLHGDIWTVTGSLARGPGGVAIAQISRRNGRIIRISHGK